LLLCRYKPIVARIRSRFNFKSFSGKSTLAIALEPAPSASERHQAFHRLTRKREAICFGAQPRLSWLWCNDLPNGGGLSLFKHLLWSGDNHDAWL
jgi:hypothetical protein